MKFVRVNRLFGSIEPAPLPLSPIPRDPSFARVFREFDEVGPIMVNMSITARSTRPRDELRPLQWYTVLWYTVLWVD